LARSIDTSLGVSTTPESDAATADPGVFQGGPRPGGPNRLEAIDAGARSGLRNTNGGADRRILAGVVLKSDRFKLETPLEEGDLGTLWRGNDPSSGAPLAVSILDADAPAEVRKLLETSAEALTSAKQAALPKVHTVQEDDDGGLNVAWEWIEGVSLGERLSKRPALTVTELIRIVTEILDGLERVHAEGAAHGEVGPGRILLSGRTERPRLVGFGLNHASFRAGRAETEDPAILASVAFASPEQARGESFASVSDDLWSISAVIYSAFTSSPPFSGSGLAALRDAVARTELAPIATVRPELKGALAEVIDRALAKEKDKRYPDAAALRKALRASLLVWGRGALVRVGRESVVLPKAVSLEVPTPAKALGAKGGDAGPGKPVEPKAPAPAAKAQEAKPAARDASATRKEMPKPSTTLATAAKPSAVRAEAARPDASKPNAGEADAAKTDAAKTDAAKTAKPDAAKTDAANADAAKTAKPDAAKTDAANADAAKTDAAKPDGAKPDAAKAAAPSAERAEKPKAAETKTPAKMEPAAKSGGTKPAAATSAKADVAKPAAAKSTAKAAAATTPARKESAATAKHDAATTDDAARGSFEELDASELESIRPPRPSVEELDASDLEPLRDSRASVEELDSAEIEVMLASDFPQARRSDRPKRPSDRPKRPSDRPKRPSDRPKSPSDRPKSLSRPPPTPKSLPPRPGSVRPPSSPPLDAAPRKRSLLVPITVFAIAVAVVLVAIWQLVPSDTEPVEPDVVADPREPVPEPPVAEPREPTPPPEPSPIAPEPEPEPEPRMIVFEGAPSEAMFFVDGRRADPAAIEVPPEGTTRRLEVRARGFEAFRSELTSSTERVALDLEPIEVRPTQTADTPTIMRTTMVSMTVAMDTSMTTMRPAIVTNPGF
jgi:serine/threonine-protein kinase